jgi:hypothetical protein
MKPVDSLTGLTNELCDWCKAREREWEQFVSESAKKTPAGTPGLWDKMPVIDSKAVAETSPIFERHLGIPLDPRLIRPGGYSSADDLVNELVPRMIAAAKKNRGKAS